MRQNRRNFLCGLACAATAGALGRRLAGASDRQNALRPAAADLLGLVRQGKKVPVIFDTDIGGDIDDTWALVMLLKSPELDLRLVVSDYTNCTYRAKILAKMLQVAGRTDVPVGVGLDKGDEKGRQSEWIGDFQLSDYAGRVHRDGVDALIQTILSSKEPVTLICTGPVPNVAEALRREPRIAERARFVGMHGSIRLGYGGRPKPAAEWNVRAAPKALQAVFSADWEITITPLDTCGLVHLTGSRYQKVRHCSDPLVQALMRNYECWAKARDPQGKNLHPDKRSTTLFDTVAVYLAYSEQLVEVEELPVRVTDDGMTVVDPKARKVRCATKWKSLDGYLDHLTSRLTG